jgi:hypothetical protein
MRITDVPGPLTMSAARIGHRRRRASGKPVIDIHR